MNLNEVNLIGRIGQDLVCRVIPSSGMQVLNFSLATSMKQKEQEVTQWHRITCFGALADNVAKYCHKGMLVYVKGRIEYSKYTNKAGVEMPETKIIAYNVNWLEKSISNKPVSQAMTEVEKAQQEYDDDQIPF